MTAPLLPHLRHYSAPRATEALFLRWRVVAKRGTVDDDDKWPLLRVGGEKWQKLTKHYEFRKSVYK